MCTRKGNFMEIGACLGWR